MATIPITGLPSTFIAPGGFVQIAFAQGPSSAGAGERSIMFVMPMLASGAAWTAATTYGPIKNEQEAIDGAGAGSPLHRAIRRALRANQGANIYALPYLPSSGGGGLVSAAGTITWSTDPTALGVARIWVAGEMMEYGFTSSDTVTTIAVGFKNLINARTHLPVSANNSSGVLTLTAKVAGVSMGDGTTGAVRMRAEIDLGKGTTVATSGKWVGGAGGTAGVDGTTTEAANLTAALATIAASRKYFMGVSVWDATSLAALQTHIANKSEPKVGHRSVGCAAFVGALAAGQALAVARNYERLQIAWMNGAEDDPASLVGNILGVRQKREEEDTAFNFDDYRRSDWLVKPASLEADWPDLDDLDDAITDGLMPIASNESGSYIAFSATTRSKDSTGATDDFRALETHRVSVSDQLADTLLIRDALRYSGFKLKSDKLLADGTVDHNQRVGERTVTPSLWKSLPLEVMAEFDEADRIQEIEKSRASLLVRKDPSNGGRIECGFDINVIDLKHQVTVRIAETSTG